MKKQFKRSISLVLSASVLFGNLAIPASAEDGAAKLYDLRINDLTAPIGIEDSTPSFSWKMDSDAIGARQSAYKIDITETDGTPVWSSDWVESEDSVAIEYAGTTPLKSSTTYAVTVTTKDEKGTELAPIRSTFETALLEEDAWDDAKWISFQNSSGSGNMSETTNYTIDFDFKIESGAQGLCFGMPDTNNLYMWQISATEGKDDNKVYLRPHIMENGNWKDYPGMTGGTLQNVDVTEATGTLDTVVGHMLHERIEVTYVEGAGTTVNTYFGTDADNLTLADTYTTDRAIPLYNVGFRKDTTPVYGDAEVTQYDNIVVKDTTTPEAPVVVYENNFDDGKVSITGTHNHYQVVDGMLRIGTYEDAGNQRYVLHASEGNVLDSRSQPAFRRTIDLSGKTLVSAKLYTSGLGVYESYINGQRVGNKIGDTVVYDELKPGYTMVSDNEQQGFTGRKFYSTYDVTWMLESGEENVLAAVSTGGWWTDGIVVNYGKESAYLAKLILTYADGTSETICTDTTTWKTAKAAAVLTGTDIYSGERYDATIDQSWMLPGYDDAAWGAPKENTEFSGEISAWSGVPITVRGDLERSVREAYVYTTGQYTGATGDQYGTVNKVRTYADGEDMVLNPGETLLVDFGQNFAGWEYLEMTAQAGTTITVEHGEMLNDGNGAKSRGCDGPEGSIYNANYRSAAAKTVYTAKEGRQTYHPSFSFYGFRYIEITADKPVTFHEINGQVVTSVHEDTGTLTTSSEDINQLVSNIRWGMYSNYLSVPTDCPQRDERLGWTGDTQNFAEAGNYLSFSKSFLEKFMEDMRDSQRSDGAYPDVSPGCGPYGMWGQLGWADAGIIVPYYLYMMYGDTSVITENWDSMVKFMGYLEASDYTNNDWTYGDWLSYEANDKGIWDMLGASYLAWDAMMMAEMAEAIGNTEAVAKYTNLYNDRKAAYQNAYVNEDGTLKRGEQTPCLYALLLDLLPDEQSVAAVTNQLISNIERNGNKLQTGFLGTAVIMHTLTKIGRTDVAYRLLLQHDNPSWLYSVDQGATTIWERWNTYTLENGFGEVGMNSFNHYSYGSVASWMFRGMAGIGYDTEDPGFKHIVLTPRPDPMLPSVHAAYDSAYGTIVSNMDYEGRQWNYFCTIPANTTATIHIPVEKLETLTVNGKPYNAVTTAADGIAYHAEGSTAETAQFEAVSGSYTFRTEVAVKLFVDLNVDFGGAAAAPLDVTVSVNDDVKVTELPATLEVSEGDVITADVSAQNTYDYKAGNWLLGDEIVGTNGELSYTVGTAGAELTLYVDRTGKANLLEGADVSAPVVNDTFAASNLVDGVLIGDTDAWSSPSQGKNTAFHAIEAVIALENPVEFDQLRLYPRMVAGQVVCFPTAYTFSISGNGNEWVEIYSTTNGEVSDGPVPVVIQLDQIYSARYIRFSCTGISGGDDYGDCYVQLSELGAYRSSETPDMYTVTFETNGGSAIAAQTIADGETVTRPDDPVKAGCTFAGWYSDEGLETEYNFNDPVSSDMTLYAKWQQDSTEQPVCAADAALRSTARRDEDGRAIFHLNLKDAEHIAAIQVTFADLSDAEISGASEFTFVAAKENTVVLSYLHDGKLFSCSGEATAAVITVPGDAPSLKIKEVKIASYDFNGEPAFGEQVDLLVSEAVYTGYDLTGDQAVDLRDIVAAMKWYRKNPTEPKAVQADVDGDGDVDLQDMIEILLNFTK